MTAFPYRLNDTDPVSLGLVVLQADETIEGDFRRLLPAQAALHVTRVPSGLEVSTQSLRAMEQHIAESAGLFPRGLTFDAVGYGCTSATAVIGRARVAELLRDGTSAKTVSEPVSALLAASRALGLKRIAYLSPYVEEVSRGMRDLLASEGLETPVFGSFDEPSEAKVARISAPSLLAAAERLVASAEVEGIFLSCTNLKTLEVIPELRARGGKPVLSSNQVLAWHMCRLAGLAVDAPVFGDLPAAA